MSLKSPIKGYRNLDWSIYYVNFTLHTLKWIGSFVAMAVLM